MERVTTTAELRAVVRARRERGELVGFVPTMGALHDGHRSLVRLAGERAATVVVSIFVNPDQFDRPDDLAAYPRDLDGDLAALAALGEDLASRLVVFTPGVSEIHDPAAVTTVTVGDLGDVLCGRSRPGHFTAVATVVAKLLNLVQPDLAVFGRKDRQQLEVIRRMVADLRLPVEIVAGKTIRDGDGLALSSRNRRLSPQQRIVALALSRALAHAVVAARAGRAADQPLVAGEVRTGIAAALQDRPQVRVDYVEVVDPATLRPPAAPLPPDGRLLAAVAAFVGEVRLIDNVELGDLAEEDALLVAAGGPAPDQVRRQRASHGHPVAQP